MSTSYDYVQAGIRDYLPGELDLERDLLLSSEVLRREYIEINPPLNKSTTISSSSLGNTIEFKLNDSSRWVDTSTLCLIADVGNIIMPASAAGASQTQNCNICMLDGPFSILSRMNVSVGGQNLTTINDLNKHMTAKWLNGAMSSHVIQEAQTLNPGCAKFTPILQSTSRPQGTQSLYGQLVTSPANFPTTIAAGANDVGCADAMGFIPSPRSALAAAYTAAGYGYQNSIEPGPNVKTICIKIGDICPFFQQNRYVPLFLLNNVIFSFYFASPQQAFFCDVGTVANAVADAGEPAAGGAPPTYVGSQNIVSYDVTSCKMVCDLITCSDVLNNRYKMLAASPEGIILPFDDISVTSSSFTMDGSAKQFQCHLSTANLKSLLFYQQSNETAQAQNGWSNTNFHYLGIQNFQLQANNNNLPNNPLSRIGEIMLYNNRSRGVIGNELSEFVCNNQWLAYANECAPLAPAANTQAAKLAAAAASIPASFVAFFVYTNFEKILNENPLVLKNGLDLKAASSTITIKWNENVYSGNGTNIPVTVLGGANGAYSAYAQMCYQRSIVLKNGLVELI